ncbi:YjbF family lipoprotein [Pacificoceanicola onchidii]|uniref:YjbF family lipoprotein n=1 Tax=Pacificoceanicola onchidii TaxID=2562685 RepID=UPI0010A65442|nr:YjbF family lipoprotein [Pacificoceanicola onchidii]
MSAILKRRFGLALIASLALAACGSEPNPAVDYLKGVVGGAKTDSNAGGVVTADQTAQVLAATPSPVEFVNIEARNSQALMIGIEQNGPYSTYGTAARQSLVLRSGMITATRGLGGDLMSSEEDALLRAVQSRQAGNAGYQMHFLTPGDETKTLSFQCSVVPGGTQAIKAGEINSGGTVMTATCRGEGGQFDNTYVVDKRGTILAGRQWVGFTIGFIGTQALRR